MKTLITGGKSAQSLKLLKAFTEDQVILADYGEAPSFSSSQYQFISLGEKNEDTIAHNLLNACLDQEADRLVPLYNFELEAVVRSLVLFEEFNIHVLLPDILTFPLYFQPSPGDTKNWALFDRGELKFSTVADLPLLTVGKEKGLNGVFYIQETETGFNPILFTIS